MLVVVAPDKFAGTLTAEQAAEAIAAGWRQARPDDEIRTVPMADGGPGTATLVAQSVAGARFHQAEVADPLGHAVAARWLSLPDGRALIESAEACGLHLVDPDRRSPLRSTTYGVGQLLRAAVDTGATEIIVGLGGSATVDGGAGMAGAWGHRLLRSDGNGLKVGAEYLAGLDRIVAAAPPSVPVIAAVDVDAPLLGPDGAVAGFAAQKGATPQDVPALEAGLRHLADIAERDLTGGPWRDLPGAGAAGGLGFGLAAFAGARLEPGAAIVAEMVELAHDITGAGAVVTGEGRLDRWSLRGKLPGAVADLARRHGVGLYAVVGQAVDGAGDAFDRIEVLGEDGLRDPVRLVIERAAALAAAIDRDD